MMASDDLACVFCCRDCGCHDSYVVGEVRQGGCNPWFVVNAVVSSASYTASTEVPEHAGLNKKIKPARILIIKTLSPVAKTRPTHI